MLKTKNYQFWFCTGSQDLYGDECLAHVAEHSKIIVDALNKSGNLPYEVVWKPTMITNEVIRKTFNEANTDENCAGVITWMHTFSPAKSWILGLQEYRKPLLHLHTQFNREIPYDTIDMDFMNENQAAHGDREYGHIFSRLNMERKVVAGYWEDEDVQKQIGSWMRTAVGVVESSHVRVMRVADNMRNVAVTEGDKVEAQIKFGWEVDAYPVNEIADYVKDVAKGDVDALVDEYYSKYDILLEGRDPEEFKRHVAVQAQIEIGFEKFLEENNYQATFVYNHEDKSYYSLYAYEPEAGGNLYQALKNEIDPVTHDFKSGGECDKILKTMESTYKNFSSEIMQIYRLCAVIEEFVKGIAVTKYNPETKKNEVYRVEKGKDKKGNVVYAPLICK